MSMKLQSRSKVILDALVREGFSVKEKAQLMNWTPANLRRFLRKDLRVLPKTASILRKHFGEDAVEMIEV